MIIHRVFQKVLPHLCGYCGGTVASIVSVVHSCIGQALGKILNLSLNQSDKNKDIFPKTTLT